MKIAFASAALLLALGGCTPAGVAVGAGASAGVAASQERGFRQGVADQGIELRVADRLLQESLDLFSKVSAMVIENRVLLTGAVRSVEARDRAGQLAWSIDGVRDVLNETQVTAGGDIADLGRDTWITTQLRTKILGDAEISDINYAIETVNGTIYLMGVGQNQREVQRVLDYARAIPGVRRVVNHVLLRDDPRRRAA